MPIEVQHEWQCDPGQRPEFLWIGRSRFCRNSTKQDCAPPDRETADASQVFHAVAMADEPGNPDPDLGGEGHHLQAGVDCSRTSCHALGGEPGDGGRQETNGGPHQDEHRRAEGEVSPTGDFTARQVQQGQPDETSEGESVTDGGGARMLRVLQGLQVQGGPRGLLAVAMEETANNPNHCPDLARLAKWAGRRQTGTSGAASGSGDPEANAVIAPPKVLPKPKQLQATPTTNKSSRTSRTRVIQTEEDSSDFSLVEQTTEEQISDLETRLAVLKSINKVEDEHAEKRKMELQ